jgi:hypothetical protein
LHPLWGTLLIVPAVLPLLVAEYLVGFEDSVGGIDARPLPYGIALAVTLAVTALGLLAVQRLTRDVAIRRTAS